MACRSAAIDLPRELLGRDHAAAMVHNPDGCGLNNTWNNSQEDDA